VVALAVTALGFIACQEADVFNTPDPAPAKNNVVINGYEALASVIFTDESEMILSQHETDQNLYNANYNGVDYKMVYTPTDNMLRMYDNIGTLLLSEQMPGSEAPNGGYPGDCDKLGARKDGESYKDCVERNFTNFCCDFLGCVALTVQPVAVIGAIGMACLTTDGKLDIDRIKNVRTGVVILDRTNQN
jgi:hypothetical protein